MKHSDRLPPKLPTRFFRWYCHPKLADHIEGDLLEVYGERLKTLGKRKADIKFAIDVLLLFRPGILKTRRLSYTANQYQMISNYFKISIRNMLRFKAFSFINIFGLSVAMSVSLLIILMLADQHAYDQFNEKKDRIYRILSERSDTSTPYASTPPSLANWLREDYADIERVTSLLVGVGGEATYNQRTVEVRGFFADEYFFDVFDFDLKYGNKDKALEKPNALVISGELSRHLFGDDNPVGKTVEFVDRGLHYLKMGKDSQPVPWGSFEIMGVLDDKFYKSHLKFDALMSSATQKDLIQQEKISDRSDNWDKSFTYALVLPGKTEIDLAESLNDVIRHYQHEEPSKNRFTPQSLTAITPGITVNQPPRFQLPIEAYYVLGLIALAIMLSACLNYTNLSVARAVSRAKEIGVRKVTGARRKDLVYQFLSESILTSFFALVLAIGLLVFIKPAFINLWLNSYLSFDLQANFSVYFFFIVFALVIGIIGGLYPAFYLSTFQPVKAIKNAEHLVKAKLGVKKVLSASQFVISLFFIITSILIHTQFQYFMKFDYGFDSTNIVNVALQGNDYEKVHHAFSSIAGVTVSASEYVPATGRTSGMDIIKPKTDDAINFRMLSANENFIPNLGLELIAGYNLPETKDSLNRFIVVNETAVQALGFLHPADIIGEVLIQRWNKEPLEVVGVVKDFWLKLPIGGDKLEPAFLRNLPGRFSYANIKVLSSDFSNTIKELEATWKSLDPVHPFAYQFYEEELDATHAGISDVVYIVSFLAFIAVSIACLGMLGMAMYTAERKKKEVGIRKVLGAESFTIALMLSKDFMKILLVSVAIGAPLSYFLNNMWLQVFPNRADFGIGIVLMGILILLVVGVLTICSQTISASRTNPVESLKAE